MAVFLSEHSNWIKAPVWSSWVFCVSVIALTARLACWMWMPSWRNRGGGLAWPRWRVNYARCALLRFLYVSKRLRFDLATSVVGPLLKPDRHPPRALPWPNVRRILQAVECSTPTSCRDYAILLLMSLYGLGGAEVIGLRLEDIDWERKTIRICRPKTQSTILLPLLPAAARALVRYLQRARPAPTEHRHVFLRAIMPYNPFSGSTVIRHMLTKYGRRAGVTTGSLGSHVLRHSQATRQVELGTPFKVVGDILGHRHPQATSHYTRSAVGRLRDLPLPLPHG